GRPSGQRHRVLEGRRTTGRVVRPPERVLSHYGSIERRRATMRLVSVNVGLPREVFWKGQSVTTGIFKEPVEGRVMLRTLNLEGDRQADLSVHGGRNKAVYAYPAEHYRYWSRELPEMPLPWGMFGENLSTEQVIAVEQQGHGRTADIDRSLTFEQ